ncbi:MAG: DUF1611 domain-containing protein [Pseudomonadota bacterium]
MDFAMHQPPVVSPDTKWAFTTRRVRRSDAVGLSTAFGDAQPGDLLVGEIAAAGQHRTIQLATGRASETYLGDRIVACVGDRYAPDQFEAFAEIDAGGCDLVAAGGIVGRAVYANDRMREPTRVAPIGLLTQGDGRHVNVADYALPPRNVPTRPAVIGVFGASMNAGKTTAAVSIAHGLRRGGFRVAGIKATGTGAFRDFNAFVDAGVPAWDFTDVGMATTYKMPIGRIEAGLATLLATAAEGGAEVAVVEFADGVFQRETAALLHSPRTRSRLDAVMFAAGDALSSVCGVQVLRDAGFEPIAVSGMVTASPLARREAEEATGARFATRDDLRNPAIAIPLVVPALGCPEARVLTAA